MNPLVDREPELDLIRRAADEAGAGVGSAFVLVGPTGIGKTALAEAAVLGGEQSGLQVMRCRGSRLERGFAYGAVRRLFAGVVEQAEGGEPSPLEGAAALARGALGHGEAGRARVESEEAVLHGLYWLCSNLGQTSPLLLHLDDIHWLDTPSLRFAAYLCQRIADLPVLLIAAVRSMDPDADRPEILEMREMPEARLLELGPISPQGAESLIRARMSEPDPQFVAACMESTGGNPLMLREMIGDLAAADVEPSAESAKRVGSVTPEAVAGWVTQRLESLSEEAGRLARSLAVFDGSTELRICAKLARLEPGPAGAAADELSAVGIFGEGRPLSFAHPLLGEAVAASIPVAEAAEAHLRAARILAVEGFPADETAAHLLESEPVGDAWVQDRLLSAGQLALDGGAPESAVAFLERARREPGAERDFRIMLGLGTAYMHVHPDPAVDPVEQALGLAKDSDQRAEAALLLVRVLNTLGRSHEAVGPLLDAIETAGEGELRDRLEAEAISAAQLHPDTRQLGVERMLAAAERIGASDPGSYGEAAVMANVAFGAAVTCSVDFERAVSLAEQALAGDLLVAESWTIAPIAYLGLTLAWSDRSEQARALLARAAEQARAVGALPAARTITGLRAAVSLRLGRVAEAEAEANVARGDMSEEAWAEVPVSVAPMLDALVSRGELDAAGDIGEAYPLDDPQPTPYGLLASLAWARYRHATGDAAAALELFRDAGSALTGMGMVNPAATAWRGEAARAALEVDRIGDAESLVAEELELARRFGSAAALGPASRHAGVVAGGDEGIVLLRESVEVMAGSPYRLELARSHVELGAALRRARQRKEAREQLRSGLDLAASAGATPLADRAQDELSRTGAQPRRRRTSGPESLTPSERQVAELAASAKTNREIAQELFVSLRTVETHLTHVYGKLEIDGRPQLAEALSSES